MDPSSRLQQAAFEYENLLLKAGALVQPDAFAPDKAEKSPTKHNYSFTEPSPTPWRGDPADRDVYSFTADDAPAHTAHHRRDKSAHAGHDEDLFSLMDSLRGEVDRLKSELEDTKAASASQARASDEKVEKMNEEIYQQRAAFDSRVDQLELENKELKLALRKMRNQLDIEQTEMLRAVSKIEKQKGRKEPPRVTAE